MTTVELNVVTDAARELLELGEGRAHKDPAQQASWARQSDLNGDGTTPPEIDYGLLDLENPHAGDHPHIKAAQRHAKDLTRLALAELEAVTELEPLFDHDPEQPTLPLLATLRNTESRRQMTDQLRTAASAGIEKDGNIRDRFNAAYREWEAALDSIAGAREPIISKLIELEDQIGQITHDTDETDQTFINLIAAERKNRSASREADNNIYTGTRVKAKMQEEIAAEEAAYIQNTKSAEQAVDQQTLDDLRHSHVHTLAEIRTRYTAEFGKDPHTAMTILRDAVAELSNERVHLLGQRAEAGAKTAQMAGRLETIWSEYIDNLRALLSLDAHYDDVAQLFGEIKYMTERLKKAGEIAFAASQVRVGTPEPSSETEQEDSLPPEAQDEPTGERSEPAENQETEGGDSQEQPSAELIT